MNSGAEALPILHAAYRRVDTPEQRIRIRAAAEHLFLRDRLKTADRAFLGISFNDAPARALVGPRIQARKMLPAIRVNEVISGTAAEEAGLRPGDLIVRFDGQPVGQAPASGDDFKAMIAAHRPGDRVRLTIVRDRRAVEMEVTLGELPPRFAGSQRGKPGLAGPGRLASGATDRYRLAKTAFDRFWQADGPADGGGAAE